MGVCNECICFRLYLQELHVGAKSPKQFTQNRTLRSHCISEREGKVELINLIIQTRVNKFCFNYLLF